MMSEDVQITRDTAQLLANELADTYGSDRTYFDDNIPDKKLFNVSSIYDVPKFQVYALYDSTLFGSGKDGVIITNYYIGYKEAFASPQKFYYEDIIISSEDDYSSLPSKFVSFLMEVKKVILQNDGDYVTIYDDYLDQEVATIVGEIEKVANNFKSEKNMEKVGEFISRLNKLNEIAIFYDEFKNIILYQLAMLNAVSGNFSASKEYIEEFMDIEVSDELQEEKNEMIADFNELYNAYLKEDYLNQIDDCLNETQFESAFNALNELSELHLLEEAEKEALRQKITQSKEETISTLYEKLKTALSNEEIEQASDLIFDIENLDEHFNLQDERIQLELLRLDFDMAEAYVDDIKDEQIKLKWQNEIRQQREKITSLIQKAVLTKNYELFEKNPELLHHWDELGMKPLMYFALLNDKEVFRLYDQTTNVDNENIFGQSTYELLLWNYDEEFVDEFICYFDQEARNQLQLVKRSERNIESLNKRMKVVEKVSDIGGSSVFGIGASMIGINQAESLIHEEDLYEERLETLNQMIHKIVQQQRKPNDAHIQLLFNVASEKALVNEQIEAIHLQIKELTDKIQNLENQEIDAVDINNSVALSKLEKIVIDDLGERDEFETTQEYNERVKAEIERRIVEKDSSVLKVLSEVNNELLEDKEEKIEELKEQIEEIQMENEPIFALKKAIDWLEDENNVETVYKVFYTDEQRRLSIGKYDADHESFEFYYLDKTIKTKIPRTIAKDFKQRFEDLPKKFRKEIENNHIVTAFYIEYNEDIVKIVVEKQKL